MLAYATDNRPAGRADSPRALAFILIGHVVLIGAVMTAKMQLAGTDPLTPTKIFNIPIKPPPPSEPQPRTEPAPSPVPQIDRTPPLVDIPSLPEAPIVQSPPLTPWTPPGTGTGTAATPMVPPKADPVRVAAIFRTPDRLLRPPYPNSKLRLEEEATLTLRLSIDARGRVTAVDPVGAADPEFLASARRHIIRSWRYQPATEDGAAVATTTVVTLSFRLDQA